MKKLNYLFFIIWLSLIPWSSALGTVGFGVQGGQSIFDASSKSSKDGVDLTTSEFANPFSGGVYLYIDVIPFIDLEADISLSAKKYSFIFSPLAGYNDIGPYDFVWADFSVYLTARKKIVGIGIPLLAKAKLFYGGGINMNTVTPVMDLDFMEDILGEDLTNNPANFSVSEKDLIDFLENNQVKTNGFHIQSGLQFKVLMLDTFLFYRHTFAKDIIFDQDHFGSLNLRMGMGF